MPSLHLATDSRGFARVTAAIRQNQGNTAAQTPHPKLIHLSITWRL